MDVAGLRAEIKSWERDFRSKHGRDPSLQEIKGQPAIAAKYKLYKSLSKATSSGNLSKPASRLATPPPQPPRQPHSSSIVPKTRAVKVDPPLSTSNPFSPVKNRKKLPDHASSSQRVSNQSRPNPFATPSKPKNKPHAPRRSPSPDPFPPIQPLLSVQRPLLSPAADSAVTRARKRLRGEPVSPSPVKEKRPRVSSQAALSFTSHAALLNSPSAEDGDVFAADHNDTFIDTPMKPLTSGRSFKVLFEDALSNGEKRSVKALPSRTKADSSAPSFLGLKREKSRAHSSSSDEDEDEDWSFKPKLKSFDASVAFPAKPGQSKTRTVDGKYGVPTAFVPTKDDLWSEVGPSKGSQPKFSTVTLSQSGPSHSSSRAPNKRALPDDLEDGDMSGANTLLDLPLIPPSPPPPDPSKPSGSKYANKGKGKAGPFGRKKAKLLQDVDAGDDETEGLEDDEIQVKEIDPLAPPSKVEHGSGAGSDGETYWRVRPPNPDISVPLSASSVDPGKFEVSLPDELQRILAISQAGRASDTEEERVVRGLLYGSREAHYDPSKGGEIWDVGEEFEYGGGTEEEWEGEPVPWELGEL